MELPTDLIVFASEVTSLKINRLSSTLRLRLK